MVAHGVRSIEALANRALLGSIQAMLYTVRSEYADPRKFRDRNRVYYRVAHWPIWIWVFFLAPGPLTFNLFAHGGSRANWIWLGVVLAGTGLAGLFGQLPGVEPRPYILRFCEDKPNPLYRRVCYTFAWNALISFAVLNLAGLLIAVATRVWYMKQIYAYGYAPLMAIVLCLGATGRLPRVKPSTAGEGIERRYFYGTVWAVTSAQTLLLVLWKTLPRTHAADAFELAAYVGMLTAVGLAAAIGSLPRTRAILPGEMIVAD
jgi:hypothetical protein